MDVNDVTYLKKLMKTKAEDYESFYVDGITLRVPTEDAEDEIIGSFNIILKPIEECIKIKMIFSGSFCSYSNETICIMEDAIESDSTGTKLEELYDNIHTSLTE